MAKDIKKDTGVVAPANEERKVSIEEFAVTFSSEKMWVDGLKSHVGAEPRTIAEWKKSLENFKKLPSK